MELCPDRELRTTLSNAKDRPDPFLRYCRSVVQLHDASLRKVFTALVSGRSAQDRLAQLLDELARGETMEDWFRTCESSVSPVADAPLCRSPMLYAQVDLHMWLDVICCGDGPVVLELSGRPETTYREMCTAATELSRK